MNEEKQAAELARWVDRALDRRGSPPEAPTDLDDDVREAVAAIRPDRAPPARLTADDLLASLEGGPLAVPGAGAPAQVIPFPDAAGVAEPRGWWRSVGGASGVGLLLAAAGVLYLFGIDSATLAPAPPPGVAELAQAPAAAVEPPAAYAPPSERLPDNALDAKGADRQMPVQKPMTGGAPRLAPNAELPLPVAQGTGDAGLEGIAESQPRAARALPADDLVGADANAAPDPGLAEMQQGVTLGAASGPQPSKEVASRDKRKYDRDETPPALEAEPAAAPPPPARQAAQFGWSAGVDPASQAEFDRARGRAQTLAAQGRPAEAAATVSAVVHAPARAGQYHAALAVDYWLAAGDPDAAAAIARQGLALSSEESPERIALLARLARAEAAAPQLDRLERMNEADEQR